MAIGHINAGISSGSFEQSGQPCSVTKFHHKPQTWCFTHNRSFISYERMVGAHTLENIFLALGSPIKP
jgi:hypothetical protein